ncbi:MAG TPA: hypothetical protein VHL11_06630, partial [Phototrophicaceae bacterium]|nr:hypothetical protein [Phototrophicaceae bacterium]
SDGNLLAVGTGSDATCLGSNLFRIQLIDLNSNTEDWLSGHDCPVTSLDFNSDGTKLVSSDSVDLVIIWNTIDKTILKRRETGIEQSVEWNPDNDVILTQNEAGILIRDQEFNNISVQGNPNEKITRASWNTQGNKIVYSNSNGVISIWNTATNVIEVSLSHHNSAIAALDWNPVNDTIASADVDGLINLWDASTGEIVASLSTETAIHDLGWSPDGQTLASAGEDGFVHIWTIQKTYDEIQPTFTEVISFDYQAAVFALAWSPDGTKLAYGGKGIDGENGQVEIADVSELPQTTATDNP